MTRTQDELDALPESVLELLDELPGITDISVMLHAAEGRFEVEFLVA